MSEELKAIAAALGLGEEATMEDVMAALQAVIEKAASMADPKKPEEEMKSSDGELGAELAKANEKIADLTKRLDSQTSLSAWKERTAKFTSISGTPTEHALTLADIESKAGKEAAELQFKALERANELTEQATKIIGTTRTGGPTDFDNEVKKYMKENKDATKAQAIDAVSKEHPELFFARRDSWDQ